MSYLRSETGTETKMCELHARSVLGFSAGHRLGVELENPLLGGGATAVALIVTPWASERAGTSPLSRTSRGY